MAHEGCKIGDQVELLAKEITRISGGNKKVTFGELARDEGATQQFETLLGTLKAARKRNIVDFKGELLLIGKHDDVMIALMDSDKLQALEELEGNDLELELDGPMSTSEVPANLAPPTHTIPVLAKETPSVDPLIVGSEEILVTEPAAEPPVAADAIFASDTEPSTTVAEALVANAQAHAIVHEVPATTAESDEATADTLPEAALHEVASGEKKWNVDISYIDHRTADPNRREVRRSIETKTGSKKENQSRCQKDQDGKWLQVDTSYIKQRTGDTNHIRRGESCTETEQFADPVEKKYVYEQLKGVASRPSDVDPACKEQYLTEEEFSTVFEMELADFSKLPKWKQQNIKKLKDLF
mmetsp:Transcript_115355/g.229963  ORF Transcript_115355/g.229963 Transcript_115355/m.229963 type:complete len:356 (-) Transcript_115355:142-1209(-)